MPTTPTSVAPATYSPATFDDRDTPERSAAVEPWSRARRVLFRIVCCYWVAFALPGSGRVFVLRLIPIQAVRPLIDLYAAVGRWVELHVSHAPALAAAYSLFGIEPVLAVGAAAVWSLLDRRRTEYRALNGWLRLLVRYMLAFTLIRYGLMKALPEQFQPLGVARLMEPFGEFSPSGVLWSFMGASDLYTVFTGAVELAAGVLLLLRRTTTLGALLGAAAMANVTMLTLSYDVGPSYPANLALMSLFLLAPVLRNLVEVLVWNRATVPARLDAPHFASGWQRTAANAFAGVFVAANLVTGGNGGRGLLTGAWKDYRYIRFFPRSPLYGLYRVESGGPPGWYKIAFDTPDHMVVRTLEDTVRSIPTEYDASARRVVLAKEPGRPALTWTRVDSTHVTLAGTFRGASLAMRLLRIDQDLLLVRHRFHWGHPGDFFDK